MKTTHNLQFEVARWPIGDIKMFRVGTVEGIWDCDDKEYRIIAITNKEPGNGHLNDTFQWFEESCKRDNRSLRICELWNKRFKNHLIKKRGFTVDGEDAVKHF